MLFNPLAAINVTMSEVDFSQTYYGRTAYPLSLEMQAEVVRRVRENPKTGFLLGFEFDPVITLGRRASVAEDVLKETKTPIFSVERGGQATFHSPGQLVIYPVCNIRVLQRAIKEWVCHLLKTTQNQLNTLSKQTSLLLRSEENGVFHENFKVTSIGLRISGGISSFGLAINLKNDPLLFNQIRVCGSATQKVGNVNYEGELEDFFDTWCEEFKQSLE